VVHARAGRVLFDGLSRLAGVEPKAKTEKELKTPDDEEACAVWKTEATPKRKTRNVKKNATEKLLLSLVGRV